MTGLKQPLLLLPLGRFIKNTSNFAEPVDDNKLYVAFAGRVLSMETLFSRKGLFHQSREHVYVISSVNSFVP